MGVQKLVLNLSKISICLIGLLSSFITILDLTYFLSDPFHNKKYILSKNVWVTVPWSLFINMSLLSVFILQHSMLALPNVKDFFAGYGIRVIYRSVYIITTAAALQVIIKNWESTPEVTLWEVNLNYRPLLWLYAGIHITAWIIIYTGNICMDVTELLGIKQVYYDIRNLSDPVLRKSKQLCRLNSHMRHPSFLGLLLIFWIVPVMSLDRFLLAAVLSTYMYLAWNTDDSDYLYQKCQYDRKFHELQYLQS